MATRKKKRTSIRTAAGAAADRYLDRIRQLRDDPLRILPECPGEEPKPVAKIRARLVKMASSKPGFFDKRDRGLIGAVANIIPVADQQAVTHLADHRIDGQRRFYLQRGHASKMCGLGVQNHDTPTVLLWAWAEAAKADALHFFAADRLVCSGTDPAPPETWWQTLAGRLETTLEDEGEVWGDGRGDKPRIQLGFRPDGPSWAVRPKRTRNAHAKAAALYRGPHQRQPFSITIREPDGTIREVDREVAAQYRAGIIDDAALMARA